MENEQEYRERIARLEQEITSLAKQVSHQEGEIEALKSRLAAQPYQPVQQPYAPNMNIQQQNFSAQYAARYAPQPNSVPQYAQNPMPQRPVQNTQSDNFEKKLGNFMGVIASVLVFIGIALFGMIAYVWLPNAGKAVCILAFSIAILAAGTVMMNKKQNTFSMSVAGCGIGAVFLSLLIIHIYFGMMNRIVLYILITAWAVLVYRFFGKRSYVFKLIGQIGVTIAVAFGIYALSRLSYENDRIAWSMQYVMLWIFMTAISLLYLMVKNERGIKNYLPFMLLDDAALIPLAWLGLYQYGETAEYAIAAAMILYLYALLYWYVFAVERYHSGWEQSVIYAAISFLTCLVSIVVIGNMELPLHGAATFLCKTAVLALAYGAECFRMRLNESGSDRRIHTVLQIVLYYLLIFVSLRFDLMMTYTGLGLYGFLMLAVAYRAKSKTSLWLSYATMALFAMTGCEYGLVMVVLYLLYAAVSGYLAAHSADMYDVIGKCGWYLTMLLLFLCCYPWVRDSLGIGYDEGAVLEYVIVAVINCLAVCVLDRSRKEEPVFYMLGGINVVMLFFGIIFLVADYHWMLELLILIAVMGTCFICIPSMYQRYSQFGWCDVYTGIKLAVFMYIIMKSYTIAGPWLSGSWLLMAIAFIVTGFIKNRRYLRRLGLFLTMFAVVKLLLFDIHFGNQLVRAAGFLVCGGICFAINMIYNKYDKIDTLNKK